MNKITKLELAMVAICLIVCGTGYATWRIQTCEDHLIPSASVRTVEKKQRVEKPAQTLPEKQKLFDVHGHVGARLLDEKGPEKPEN
jgi:hypothetical protein